MVPIPKTRFGKRLRYASLMVNEKIFGLIQFPFSLARSSGFDVGEPYHVPYQLSNDTSPLGIFKTYFLHYVFLGCPRDYSPLEW